MEPISFKTRVKETLINASKLYREHLVNFDYLIYSSEFQYEKYYIVSAKEDNFYHLTGVESSLKSQAFFDACVNGTLLEDDFDVGDKRRKGTIRRKIKVIEGATQIFLAPDITIEEKFVKNKVSCSFASSDNQCTLGFTKTKISKPMTLLKDNELQNEVKPEFIARKKLDEEVFNEIILNVNGLDLESLLTELGL